MSNWISMHDSGTTQAALVALNGALSYENCAAFRTYMQHFIAKSAQGIIAMDVANITYMDAAGIAVFIEIYQWCLRKNAQYIIVRPSATFRLFLTVYLMQDVFVIKESLEEVISSGTQREHALCAA